MDRNLLMWYQCNTVVVALRKESVDRNADGSKINKLVFAVALRKESVDRNCFTGMICRLQMVALRKESVDRNN